MSIGLSSGRNAAPISDLLAAWRESGMIDRPSALRLAEEATLDELLVAASQLRARGKGAIVSFSKKVFIPLTTLCRDYCGYCTFHKDPELRLRTIEEAGKLSIAFTTGILIGIGETFEERVDSLFVIRALHEQYGHVQEVIVQNFRAKPDIPMAHHPEPSMEDMLRTIAIARLILGPHMNLQAPPNL